jgi:hypothetical protein
MDIDLDLIISMFLLLSTGLGLGLALKFFKWISGFPALNDVKWVIEKPFVRLTIWLILGSLLAKPFMDLSSLLIQSAQAAYMFTLPVSDRGLPSGWEIQHYLLHLGIRALLLVMSYGYTVWALPRMMALLSLEKGNSVSPHSLEGISITLVCGNLFHSLIAYVAIGVQQLPLSTLFQNEDSVTGYFIGWLIAIILLPLIMFGLHKIVNRQFETIVTFGTNSP